MRSLSCAIADDRMILFIISHDGLTIHLKPDILNTIIPEIINFLPKSFFSSKKVKRNMSIKISASIMGKISLKFISNNEIILISLNTKHIEVDILIHENGEAKVLFSIDDFEVIDENSTSDRFRNVLKVQDNNKQFIRFSMNKLKNTMRYPVFSSLEINIYPVIINISRKFIEDLINNFPSAKDLNILIFDKYQEYQNDDIKKFDAALLQNYNNENSTAGFYGHIRVYPVLMKFNYQSSSGFIRELFNRRFEYNGADLYDLFGTGEKLKEFFLSEFKWSLIKSLPKIAFGT